MAWTFFTIVVAIPSVIALVSLILRLSRFVRKRITYPDLAIGPIYGHEGSDQIGTATLKVAYSGTSTLLISGIQLRSRLDFISSRDRRLAWFQLLHGYWTNDIEGLEAMLGPRFTFSKPSWFAKIMNRILGFLWLLLLLSWLYSPFGWFAILLASPMRSY